MLRVCLFCAIAGSGGVEHHVLGLAKHLSGKADVAVVSPKGSWLANAAAEAGLAVRTPAEPRGNLDAPYVRTLRRLLRDQNPDVIHTHLGRSDWYGWLATRGLGGVTLVSTEHGISATRPELYGSAAARALRRRVHARRLRDVDALIAVSRATRDALVDRYPLLRHNPPIVVYPGVDCARFSSLRHSPSAPSEPLHLACISRLSPEKGVDVLLRALAGARHRGLDAHLDVCGDGDQRAGLEILAAELGIRDAVAFVGRLDDVAPVLARADALVIPSRSENLPLVALEALAAGVPVVVTSVGGLPEVVRPGRNGWLVAPENPEALADTLLQAGDRTVLVKLAENAHRDGATFDDSRMAERVLAVYRHARER